VKDKRKRDNVNNDNNIIVTMLITLQIVAAHWARAVASALGVCLTTSTHPASKVR